MSAPTHTVPLMPLAAVTPGRRVRMRCVTAGRELEARLADLGLVPGVEIEVIRNAARGPLLVSVKGSRLALGHGMARKIAVE